MKVSTKKDKNIKKPKILFFLKKLKLELGLVKSVLKKIIKKKIIVTKKRIKNVLLKAFNKPI